MNTNTKKINSLLLIGSENGGAYNKYRDAGLHRHDRVCMKKLPQILLTS
jgi:hypothetical protein